MTTSNTPFAPEHKDDFGAVYNLPDPRPYYGGLRPADYRMPEVLGRTLRKLVPWYVRNRGLTRTPLLLDFAAGFGAVGAMLRHDLSMAELYAYYGQAPIDGATEGSRKADHAWYLARRRTDAVATSVIGIDIATEALGYARAMGLIDSAYDRDLALEPVSGELARQVPYIDLVVEAGSVGPVQAAAFETLLASGTRPWFLRSPRPDVDWGELEAVFASFGYRSEALAGPVRYRRPLSTMERDQSAATATALGRSDAETFVDGYLSVWMTLTRPVEDAERWPATGICDALDLQELCG